MVNMMNKRKRKRAAKRLKCQSKNKIKKTYFSQLTYLLYDGITFKTLYNTVHFTCSWFQILFTSITLKDQCCAVCCAITYAKKKNQVPCLGRKQVTYERCGRKGMQLNICNHCIHIFIYISYYYKMSTIPIRPFIQQSVTSSCAISSVGIAAEVGLKEIKERRVVTLWIRSGRAFHAYGTVWEMLH